MSLKSIKSLKPESLLSAVESRIDSSDYFFLLASPGSGEVLIVDTLTDFGDALYLEMGRGEKNELLKKAKSFIKENTLLNFKAS